MAGGAGRPTEYRISHVVSRLSDPTDTTCICRQAMRYRQCVHQTRPRPPPPPSKGSRCTSRPPAQKSSSVLLPQKSAPFSIRSNQRPSLPLGRSAGRPRRSRTWSRHSATAFTAPIRCRNEATRFSCHPIGPVKGVSRGVAIPTQPRAAPRSAAASAGRACRAALKSGRLLGRAGCAGRARDSDVSVPRSGPRGSEARALFGCGPADSGPGATGPCRGQASGGDPRPGPELPWLPPPDQGRGKGPAGHADAAQGGGAGGVRVMRAAHAS